MAVIVREISTMQLKKCYRKGCQIIATNMEETPKDKVSKIEYYEVLRSLRMYLKEYQYYPLKAILISI
jgi:hypothetical protein